MQEFSQHARDVALDSLKPTPRDLERGLAHHEAVVIDAYGFDPRSPVDGDAFKAVIDAGASEAELQDLFETMTMTRHGHDPALRRECAAAWTRHTKNNLR